MSNIELSFIIPTLNEQLHIGGVLDSIMENVAGRFHYEVLVVDNGSHDRTVDIAREKSAICLEAFGCTVSSVRNLGASKANSNIFVFLDADVYLKKDWGRRIKPILEMLHYQHDIITGSFCGISEENNWIEKIWFAPRTIMKDINYMNSGHLIVHRKLFDRIGGFASELETGEDCDFCSRARKVGARIENDPGLKVVHAGYPKSIKRFFDRERWHARGDYRSVTTLVSSKPALISLANLCMVITCIICMAVYPQTWLMFAGAYIFFLVCVSLVAAINKYRGKLQFSVLGASFLYMIYFTARTVAMVDVAFRSLTVRRPVRTSD